MRIHVTGAGGFIGSHLCPALAAAGHELRASADGCDAVVHLANIAHARASTAELHRVNVEGTIAQAYALQSFPYLVFVDAEGKVRYRLAGEVGPEQLDAGIAAITGG